MFKVDYGNLSLVEEEVLENGDRVPVLQRVTYQKRFDFQEGHSINANKVGGKDEEEVNEKELQEVLSQCPKCNLEYNDDCEICNGHFPEKDEE